MNPVLHEIFKLQALPLIPFYRYVLRSCVRKMLKFGKPPLDYGKLFKLNYVMMNCISISNEVLRTRRVMTDAFAEWHRKHNTLQIVKEGYNV